MPRLQLLELEDLPLCPSWLRDAATRVLVQALNWSGWPQAIAAHWGPWLEKLGYPPVLDCCSGSAGPLGAILQRLPVRVTLTDRFPNRAAWEELAARFPGRVHWVEGAVDARCPPPESGGVWSFFNSFHHLDREDAAKVVAEAVYRRRPLAVFEALERRWERLPLVLVMPLFALLAGVWTRPWSWRRLFWTYCIPLLPFLLLWDGCVSCFRVYGPEEWNNFIARADPEGSFEWEPGTLRLGWVPVNFPYVLGRPRNGFVGSTHEVE
jgi:hypothetical protein